MWNVAPNTRHSAPENSLQMLVLNVNNSQKMPLWHFNSPYWRMRIQNALLFIESDFRFRIGYRQPWRNPSETKIPRNNKINIKLLPSQRCVLHVLVCLDGPRPLQSLPPFAGRGLLHKRERSWVPLPHVRSQGPQSLHSEYPPCTVTPDSSQFYQTKWTWKMVEIVV